MKRHCVSIFRATVVLFLAASIEISWARRARLDQWQGAVSPVSGMQRWQNLHRSVRAQAWSCQGMRRCLREISSPPILVPWIVGRWRGALCPVSGHGLAVSFAAPAFASSLLEVDGANATAVDIVVCAICFCDAEPPLELPCGHVFCRGCIFAWLRRSGTCPMCRQEVAVRFLRDDGARWAAHLPKLLVAGGLKKLLECAFYAVVVDRTPDTELRAIQSVVDVVVILLEAWLIRCEYRNG